LEQWSWDQHDSHSKYFDVGNHGGRQCLRVRIYDGDQSFQEDSSTAPRTELSQKSKDDIVPGVDYSLTWDWQLESLASGFQFAFMQLFDSDTKKTKHLSPVGVRQLHSLVREVL
jgi:hypothetical protein